MGLDAFFSPNSIAVVGASRRPGSFGYEILRNLAGGYRGRLYAVNPKYSEVLGVPSYPSLRGLPEVPELVVVAVRADIAVGVVEEAASLGSKGVIVVSGGFSESGGEGARLEEELIRIVRRSGIRLLGPNCIGVYDPVTGVDTFFLPRERMPRPSRGYASLISQSGAFLTTLMEWAYYEGLGVYRAVNIGNKADVDEADLIEYMAGDEYTRVIGVYIEGVKHGRGRSLLKAVSRLLDEGKRIVFLKGGRTGAGSRATLSHTASLAGDYKLFRDLVENAGGIIVETPLELIDSLKMLSLQHRTPKGDRVLVVTNAGGPGVIATDSLEELGLSVPRLPGSLVERLKSIYPPIVSVVNPIDLTGGATNEDYRRALREVLPLGVVDMVLVVAPLQPATVDKGIAWIIAEELYKARTPGAVVMIGGREAVEAREVLESLGIPVYNFPHRAAHALYTLYRAGRPRCKPPTEDPASPVPSGLLGGYKGKVPEHVALEAVRGVGMDVARWCVAGSPGEAEECFREVGSSRVVMKVISPGVVHKSDVGGVMVGISSPAEARRAYDTIITRVASNMPGARIDGVLVQEMVEGGLEAFIGGRVDEGFGRVLIVGLGGILVEVVRDFRAVASPVDECNASKAVESLRMYRLLREGYRGMRPGVEALVDALIKASRIFDLGAREFDLNPVMLVDGRAIVVDARIITG